jgi:hypothetical protein
VGSPFLTFEETASRGEGVNPVCMAIMPMTLDRVGVETPSEDDRPTLVTSVQRAFDLFQPTLCFRGSAGDQSPPIEIQYRFRCLDDFEPERLRAHQPPLRSEPYMRNDLADLQDYMASLRRLRRWWQSESAQNVWSNPGRRKRFISALARLRHDLQETEANAQAVHSAFETMPASGLMVHSAAALLAQLDDPLRGEDTHETAAARIQAQISRSEEACDNLLGQAFEQVRAIERSYRTISLFLLNAASMEDQARPPAELWILNCDASAMTNPRSSRAFAATERFLRDKNDSFSFQGHVCTLAVPAALERSTRECLEEVANRYGAVLISQIGSESTVTAIRQNFRVGRTYGFVKFVDPQDFRHVLAVGSLQLRPPHWFEHGGDVQEGLLGSSSVVLAAVLARIERKKSPLGEVFRSPILGCDKSVPSFGVGDFNHYGVERQLVIPVRGG